MTAAHIYRPRGKPAPVQVAVKWPRWATVLSLCQREPDAGVGDTLARLIGPIGGDAFKAWHETIFNKPCGCGWRQKTLNAKYPYR